MVRKRPFPTARRAKCSASTKRIRGGRNRLSSTRSAETRAAANPRPSCLLSGLFGRAQAAHAFEHHRNDDRAANEGALPEGIDAEQAKAVAYDLDQRRADECAESGADSARKV